MKFRHVNPHNVAWLVPGWAMNPIVLARTMDKMLADYAKMRRLGRWDAPLSFWIKCSNPADWDVEIFESEDGSNREAFGLVFIETPEWAISVPLNPMLKGSPSLKGTHSVYYHCFQLDVDLAYIGITKRPWFDRYIQHRSSARNGSPYLFHQALRQHADRRHFHKVFVTGLDEETALTLEEQLVGEMTLYPLGLNMIPGGKAGIQYLHRLGLAVRSAEERDSLAEQLASRETVAGRPNPLCAARWEQDQDFINRVICGHSGRLTAEQVRIVRLLGSRGVGVADIAARIGDRVKRVQAVLCGATYGRVA